MGYNETVCRIGDSSRLSMFIHAGRGIIQMFAVVACLLLSSSCDSKLGKRVSSPEVRVQHRGSILDNSLVVIITNAGAKPLFDVQVSSHRWDKRFLISSNLKPGDSVEAGWLELPSGLQIGDSVEIYAEGYGAPYKAILE
jgi:hypothetical protein